MPTLTITVAVDGQPVANYNFKCSQVLPPTKVAGGSIEMHFDPVGDEKHKLEISSSTANPSQTIKGANAATTSA